MKDGFWTATAAGVTLIVASITAAVLITHFRREATCSTCATTTGFPYPLTIENRMMGYYIGWKDDKLGWDGNPNRGDAATIFVTWTRAPRIGDGILVAGNWPYQWSWIAVDRLPDGAEWDLNGQPLPDGRPLMCGDLLSISVTKDFKIPLTVGVHYVKGDLCLNPR